MHTTIHGLWQQWRPHPIQPIRLQHSHNMTIGIFPHHPPEIIHNQSLKKETQPTAPHFTFFSDKHPSTVEEENYSIAITSNMWWLGTWKGLIYQFLSLLPLTLTLWNCRLYPTILQSPFPFTWPVRGLDICYLSSHRKPPCASQSLASVILHRVQLPQMDINVFKKKMMMLEKTWDNIPCKTTSWREYQPLHLTEIVSLCKYVLSIFLSLLFLMVFLLVKQNRVTWCSQARITQIVCHISNSLKFIQAITKQTLEWFGSRVK